MDGAYQLTTEERARIEEIQNLLIERYVALRGAYYKRHNIRAREIEIEIDELHREIEEIKGWAKPRD
jgi:ABC-type transporter lipoprotein component MlaA